MLDDSFGKKIPTGFVFTVKYRECSTGMVKEINPCVDDAFFDTMYRRNFRSGEYILISGELPDKWK